MILVGLPGAGKSTFYRQRFHATHVLVSKDLFRANRAPARRQAALIDEALAAGRDLVVDNTNPRRIDRAPIIAAARAHAAQVIGYLFDEAISACRERNARREGRARIPEVALYVTAKRLERPVREEGFDELYRVRIAGPGSFSVEPC